MYGSLESKKAAAIENYKKARAAYLENRTEENWIAFCDARILCRHLGCNIF